MTYYVYVHARPNTTSAEGIFYVGKGLRSRITPSVAQRRNAHHQNIVKKYGVSNILVGAIECSSEEVAFELEQGLIKCLRRMGVSLVNMTDGGEGISGFKMPEHCSGDNHPMKRAENRSKVAGDRSPTKRDCVRAKLSLARKSRIIKDSTKQLLSEKMIDRYSEESARRATSVVASGRTRINNGTSEKAVKSECVNDYLLQGWTLGRLKHKRAPATEETKKKISQALSGRVAHNKGKASPLKGIRRSEDVVEAISKAREGGRWITDGVATKYTHDDSLPEGWYYGRTAKKCV